MTAAPGPIEPTKTTTIPVRGGALYAETFVPKSSPLGVVLVTHGYAEHCGRYHEVAHAIVNEGWAALTYDVRGHGKSPGARGAIDRFETYLEDFRAAHAAARALVADAPLALLGHSHGSLIVLRALCDDRPPEAACAILASPYLALRMAVPGYKNVLARVASRVAPNLAQPNQLKVEQLTSDPGKQDEWRADKLNFGIARARWFTEVVGAQEYVERHADRITLPTTWLVGGADPVCDPAASRRVASRVRRAVYHDLVGMKHEVFNEVDRARVFAEMAKALGACTAAKAESA